MNIDTGRTHSRHPAARPHGRRFQGLKPLALRGLDIVVSVVAICFLAPVFMVLAAVPLPRDSLGLSQLPQLFQVLNGEMSLFDGRAR